MKVTQLRDRALVAMLLASQEMGFVHRPFAEFLEFGRLSVAEGMDRLLLAQLSASKFVEFGGNMDDYDPEEEPSGKDLVRISWSGIEAAEALLEKHPEYSGAKIPAADRYVAIDDNQRTAFQADLTELKEAVRGANEVTEDDRETALYEIAVMEAAVVAPRAATDLVKRFVDSVLDWITSRFSTAIVAEVAQRLVQALLKLM